MLHCYPGSTRWTTATSRYRSPKTKVAFKDTFSAVDLKLHTCHYNEHEKSMSGFML